jgi:hypothetical protein
MSRSTFSVLFYANKSKLKNGIVPIMGRVTINGTQSQFSCKQSIPLDLWDVKGNRAKGRSREALQLNRDLDSIKAQLIKHYQHLSDKDGFVTCVFAVFFHFRLNLLFLLTDLIFVRFPRPTVQ